MTFREFCLRFLAYERLECRNWERTRWLGLKMLEPYLDKKSNLTVYDLFDLPSDPSPAERKEMMAKRKKQGDTKFQDLKKKLTEMGYKV